MFLYLTIAEIGVHALRRPKDPPPRKARRTGLDQEGCGEREHQFGVGLPQHLHKDGADLGDEGEQPEIKIWTKK